MDTGEKRCTRALVRSVVSFAGSRISVVLIDTSQYEELFAECSQWFQYLAKAVIAAFFRRPPLFHVHSVRAVHESQSEDGFCGGRKCRQHRIQKRQCQCGTGATQKCPARNRLLEYRHDDGDLLIWNG